MVGGRRAESHWPRSRPTSSTPRRCAWPLIEVRCRPQKALTGNGAQAVNEWRSTPRAATNAEADITAPNRESYSALTQFGRFT